MAGLEDFFTWIKENPGSAGAISGMLGTLLDPAQPATTTTQQNVQLPSYIAPYAGRMLNQAESLSQEGYTPYTAPRIADFNPDQRLYRDRVLNLDPMTPQQTQGAGIVGQAAQGLLGSANNTWDSDDASHYMSPYIQNVIDVQKREAQRDYDKQLPVMDAQAVKAGAFGGSRQALLQSEAQRNLNTRLGDIEANGLQSAYTNAEGQFNNDMSRQGSMLTGASGAGSTLAGIGQQNFQNQLATNSALLGVGDRQQQLEQKSLDTGYTDFQAQRDDPMKKLQYMQSFLTGLPMTQYATANATSAPTLAQQLTSSGIGGYNLGTQLSGR